LPFLSHPLVFPHIQFVGNECYSEQARECCGTSTTSGVSLSSRSSWPYTCSRCSRTSQHHDSRISRSLL
jgi:hypothetical protein